MINISTAKEDSDIFEEQLFAHFVKMRKQANIAREHIYDDNDEFIHSETFKKGFIAGVKIASIIFND